MDLISALALIVALFLLTKWYLNFHFTYWSRRGIPQMNNPNYFFGDVESMAKEGQHLALRVEEIYKEFKNKGHKFGGVYLFFSRQFLYTDPDLLMRMFQKDFQYFQGTGLYHHEKDTLNQHLLALSGERWKKMRSSLSPTFSSAQIKNMFETILVKAENLKKHSEEIATSSKPFEARDLMARYTTDVIVTSAFGVECDSLDDPNNLFRKHVQHLFEFPPSKFFKENIVPWSILGNLGHKLFGTEELASFFVGMVKETAEVRKRGNVSKKDFFSNLLNIKSKDFDTKFISEKDPKPSSEGLSYNQIAAQSFLFFVGGFETTSTTMSFALLNMAMYPEYQAKCRDEIEEVLQQHEGKMTFEAASELTYLDRFLLETLRIYSPFQLFNRECTKDYTIPGTNSVIEKGTKIIIPIRALHMDPEYYPNPEVFNPDNFTKENRQKRPEGTFIPFGEGPRQCIGMRFGLLNAKIGIAAIIKDFNVKVNSKMQLPVVIDGKVFFATAKGDIWLDLEKI